MNVVPGGKQIKLRQPLQSWTWLEKNWHWRFHSFI